MISLGLKNYHIHCFLIVTFSLGLSVYFYNFLGRNLISPYQAFRSGEIGYNLYKIQ